MSFKTAKNMIKKFRSKGKDYYAWTRYSKYYEKLPLDSRQILAVSKHGEDIAGNIFSMLQEVCTNPEYAGFKTALVVTGKRERHIRGILRRYGLESVELVRRGSDRYYRLAASAKFLLNDTSFFPHFIKKEGQVYLNTWHGTPFKCMGKSDASGYHSMGNIQRNFLMADYLLYPNEYMKEHMIRDYMLENLASGSSVLCGYPRNSILMQDGQEMRNQMIEDGFITEEQKAYAYLPTWRGFPDPLVQARAVTVFMSQLIELDDELTDDEVVFVKLHPLAKAGVDFKAFRHIKRFPQRYEMYNCLSGMDGLITDYSSILYDYAVSGKKIILFTYDEAQYLEGRGLYGDISSFPFPRPATAAALAAELRSPICYDASAFLQTYCPYDGPDSAAKLAALWLKGENGGLKVEKIPGNGKDNILYYTGNLAKNGITSAALAALHNVDTDAHNYIACFPFEKLGGGKTNIRRLPENVAYVPLQGKTNMTLFEKAMMAGFRRNLVPSCLMHGTISRIYRRDIQRLFPGVEFSNVIQYMGYEWKRMLQFNEFDARSTIFVHNNMVEELANKSNCHRRTLVKCYSEYDNVAIVTEDIREATASLSRNPENITVVNNTVNFDEIEARGREELLFDADTKCAYTAEELTEILDASSKVFVNVGRFSAEKGQIRLIDAFEKVWMQDPEVMLVIIGGYGSLYNEVCEHAASKPCSDRIIVIRSMSNPHPVIRRCSWFALSSSHEGLGLVLLEATIHGLPVFSTDIPGPAGFMRDHGGLLVEDSMEGIQRGMEACLAGQVPVLHVDGSAYNAAGVAQFEALVR